jgi:3',5'-cyclic AMP phosphodiesterase CpdA
MTETRPWPLIPPVNDGVLVHHVSDTHFGYRPWSFGEGNHLLRDLNQGLIPIPDILVHTGDITDGDLSQQGTNVEDAYALSWLDKATLTRRLLCMGNHDIRDRKVHTRASWESVFGQSANAYADVKGVRFITFAVDDFSNTDSMWTVPAATWDWVAAVATAHTGPVVLADHYPPKEFGGLLDQDVVLPQAALNEVVGDVPNIVGMLCGHLHRDINDLAAAQFVTIGGRQIPLLADISAMLSLQGEPGRDQSAKIQSTTAYIVIRDGQWQIHYRRHGSHAWGGPFDQRVTTMDLVNHTITRGMS